MIGVILWSDPTEQKAVIWCEDHGDLAFLSQPDNVHLPDMFVDVGDVVEFDLHARGQTRKVQNVKVLSGGRGVPLIETLKSATPEPRPQTRQTAEVIPFRLASPTTRRADPASHPVQRQG